MLSTGTIKKERRNPNDPARFIGKVAATEDGETAKIHNYLDTEKIEQEALYDGMYAVTTDLLDDDVKDILKVSEGRWEIEKCFRIMKTDFETKPFFLQDDIRIKAHFLICFLALVIYRYLERDLENAISYETILDKLRTMKRPGIKYYIPKQHRKSPNLSKIKRYSDFFCLVTVKDRIITCVSLMVKMFFVNFLFLLLFPLFCYKSDQFPRYLCLILPLTISAPKGVS